MDLICWIKGWYMTIKKFFKTGCTIPIRGHITQTEEVHENCVVIIGYCTCCSKPSITWAKGDVAEDLLQNERKK